MPKQNSEIRGRLGSAQAAFEQRRAPRMQASESGTKQQTACWFGSQLRRPPPVLAPESVLAWIIIGAIAGWLAGVVVKGYGFGLIGNIVVGILGAGIAGLLAPRLGLYTESTAGNIVAATLGAIILLFLIGLLRRA
jgi:uncharacterized membrane protein YeaQ/YmgE (transglycosylase-associated protein family)